MKILNNIYKYIKKITYIFSNGYKHKKQINLNKKVNIYIDGFNFYYALQNNIKQHKRNKELQRCDFHKLFSNFLQNDEIINEIYFFTAYRLSDPLGEKRHKDYIKVLVHSNVKIILGKYLEKTSKYTKNKNKIKDIKCSYNIHDSNKYIQNLELLLYQTYEEKETDVKIAIQILEDGLLNKFDHAYIVSGDSDITPPIKSIKKLFSQGKISEKLFSSVLISNTKGAKIRKFCDITHDITFTQMKNSTFSHKINIGSEIVEIPKERL